MSSGTEDAGSSRNNRLRETRNRAVSREDAFKDGNIPYNFIDGVFKFLSDRDDIPLSSMSKGDSKVGFVLDANGCVIPTSKPAEKWLLMSALLAAGYG